MASYQKLWDIALITFKFLQMPTFKKENIFISLIYKGPYKFRYSLVWEL